MAAMTYIKRSGTGAVQGQLYETKLISLILFRLLHNKDIKQFYLASNYDGIGPFDDICFEAKIKGRDRPILVFIQAKHKENDDARLDFDLIKHFYDSFIKIKERISLKGCPALFSSKFRDDDCVFILYTNAKYNNDLCDRVSSYNHDILNNILVTGGKDSQGFQPKYTNEDLQILNEKMLDEEIATLAEHFAKFLNDKSMNVMLDPCILQYHVILAQHVVHISDVKSNMAKENQTQTDNNEWRTLKFRPNFFYTEDKVFAKLKKKIYEQMLKKNIQVENDMIHESALLSNVPSTDVSTTHSADNSSPSTVTNAKDSKIEQQISLFLSEPSATTLSPLIGTHIIYENKQLKFTGDRPSSEHQKLKQIKVSVPLIAEAKLIKILLSLRLKVPVTFGNIDLTVRGSDKRIEKRLDHLVKKIVNMCRKAKLIDSYKILTLDEGDESSSVSGDIGGLVGNLLIHDDALKCLMFTNNSELLQKNARRLFNKLRGKINDLHLYRFDMKAVTKIPKLAFDYTDIGKTIVNNVLVFEKQANHKMVEEILIDEIAAHQRLSHSNLVKLDKKTIFLFYHNRVQEWWMKKDVSSFLTNTNDFYKQTINDIIEEPQMSAMHNMFYMNNIEYFKYDFTEDALGPFKCLQDHLTIIVVSDITTLTTMKVIRCQRNKYNMSSVVDLERMLKLPNQDFYTLINELRGTKKLLIVVCNSIKSSRLLYKRLDELSEVTKGKRNIVITHYNLDTIIQEYFCNADVIIHDNKQSLMDLIPESRTEVMKEAQVLFQGQETRLDMLVQHDSFATEFLKGAVFNKMLRNEPFSVGKSFRDSKYDEIKHLYIDRRVSRHSHVNVNNNELNEIRYGPNFYTVKTFHDIEDDVVLIKSTPGLGKSTLLSHISHKTNEGSSKLWIVRINLLEYTKEFETYQKNKTVIDTSTMLYFMCQVTLINNKQRICLKETDCKMKMIDCTADEEATFELNLFLHFYNNGKIIFLFDGFDEICPNYKDLVLNIIKVIQHDPRKNKIWVTSRPYREVLPDLKRVLGEAYLMECIDAAERAVYLDKFWRDRIPLEILSDEQRNTVISSLHSMEYKLSDLTLHTICFKLKKYLETHEEEQTPEMKTDTLSRPIDYREVNKFLGTPLLLYLLTDYFANLVIDFNPNKLGINFNVFHIYERFIETKLVIFFQNKHRAEISMPYFKKQYESELKECLIRYQKLGAYAVFRNSLYRDDCRLNEFKYMPFNKENVIEIETLIKNIEGGEDTTGLISFVTPDNVPIFIHGTFAEYFATEFVCEIIKSSISTYNKRLLYSAIRLYNNEIYSYWIREKRRLDRRLDRVITEIERYKSISDHDAVRIFFPHPRLTMEQNIRIYNSSLLDYEYDMEDFLDSLKQQFVYEDDYDKLPYLDEFLVRMGPHLQRYFPSAPFYYSPVVIPRSRYIESHWTFNMF